MKTNYDPYTIRTESFRSSLDYFRPDATIEYDNGIFFIEQDMGTETRYMLREKWDRYRVFHRDIAGEPDRKKIVILLVVTCDPSFQEQRRKMLLNTLGMILDLFVDKQFELYIGTKEEMLKTAFMHVLPKWHNLSLNNESIISDSSGVLPVFKKGLTPVYDFVSINGNVVTVEDNYDYAPISVLSKMTFWPQHQRYFEELTGKQFQYSINAELNNERLVKDLEYTRYNEKDPAM